MHRAALRSVASPLLVGFSRRWRPKTPNRVITLCDGSGGVVAQHDPLPGDDGGLPHVKATCREDRRIDQN